MITARRSVQLGLLAFTIAGVFAVKGNAERWCPFGGVEAIYTYAREGNMLCSLGVTSFYVLAGVLLSVLLLRRAFCGYLCPLGTIFELLRETAAKLKLPGARVTGAPDRALALLKYAAAATILVATWKTSELVFRAYDPCYALISRNGEDITRWAYVIAGGLVLASLFIVVPFCRWLCPLAAVLNPFSRFALARVKRDTAACHSCGKCARVCPEAIPVDKVETVTAARCTSCLKCVDACPKQSDGALSWGPPGRHRWGVATLISILLTCTAGAVAGSFLVPIASFVKTRGQLPAHVATVELKVTQLTCRGRATLMAGYLERDDLFALSSKSPASPAFYKLEAWPGQGTVKIRISYDPSCVAEADVKAAITAPFYDLAEDKWWTPPFTIEGYKPLGPRIDPKPAQPTLPGEL